MFLVLFSCTIIRAQEKITISFDQDGRLTSKPYSRFDISKCTSCKEKNKFKVNARVLLPLDYFDEEKLHIDSMAKAIVTAIGNPYHVLTRILSCGKQLERLKKITAEDTNITKWHVDKVENKDGAEEIIPSKLIKFRKFISVIDSVKENVSDTDGKLMQKYLDRLNKDYKEFIPYQFSVKGYPIEENCIRFVNAQASDNYCQCIAAGKKYIAVEFDIPSTFLLSEDLPVDAFVLTQRFVMKENAINHYNKMLALHKADINKLKSLQTDVKNITGLASEILQQMENKIIASDKCVGDEKTEKIKSANYIIDSITKILDFKIGKFTCDSGCIKNNLVFCSDEMANWLVRLVWLNGELIRLNPFPFTNQKIVVPQKRVENDKPQMSEADLIIALKNDSIRIAFATAEIRHFQDSALINKDIGIDSAQVGIEKLTNQLSKATKDLNTNTAAKKEIDDYKSKNISTNKINSDKMASFLTTSKLKYKGWIVPYKTDEGKMWIRNYNYDSALSNRLINQGKYAFGFPEGENTTILVHNLRPGMAFKVSESLSPGSDKSEWEVFAGEAIQQITQLYTSIQPAAVLVKKALQFANFQANKLTLNIADGVYNIDPKANNKNILEKIQKSSTFKLTMGNYSETNKASDDSIQKAKQFKEISARLQDLVKRSSEDSCKMNYLAGLVSLGSAPDLIDAPMEFKKDTVAAHFTYLWKLKDSIPAYTNKYTINLALSNTEEGLKNAYKHSSFINVAPYHRFALAAGIAYSPNGGAVTSVDSTASGFTINRDQDKVRLIVGVRWYPLGLYKEKNPNSLFRDWRWLHRFSVLLATGVPKPLENLYTGVGFDVFPGLTISGGSHFQQQNDYIIINNQVNSRNVSYQGNWFYSLTMNPQIFISAITSLFKK